MDASLLADQSGLSDLSAASIDNGSHLLDTHLPLLAAPASPRSNSASVPVLAPPLPNATPGSSRLSTHTIGKSAAAWTPSPDADASRSKSNSRSLQPSSPKHARDADTNESMGSSLGTFDFSNASFSDSFFRRAGARMLAGLDEAPLPLPSSTSSSPRYRNSSSPTVTAKPIRPVDPRTPFTGKSLRTRMAEAGMLDSPASSDGSSPASSPSARTLPEGYHRTISTHHETSENVTKQSFLDSAQPDQLSTTDSPSVDRPPHGNTESPIHRPESTETNSFGLSASQKWQEGLSMVPEESYNEDASQFPTCPVELDHTSPLARLVDEESTQSASPSDSVHFMTGTSSFSVSVEDHDFASRHGTEPSKPASSPEHIDENSPTLSHSKTSGVEEDQRSPKSDCQANQSMRDSARPRSSPAVRAPSTPRSFARLRVGTPARSSPLSRVVNFSPCSAGSTTSQWQSSVSLRNDAVSSPPPSAGGLHDASGSPQDYLSSSPKNDQLESTDGDRRSHIHTPTATISALQSTINPSQQWSPATLALISTPASQRAQQLSAPASAGAFQTPLAAASAGSASASPTDEFGTPQWTPSLAALSARTESRQAEDDAARPDASAKSPAEAEEEEPASSSACSSASVASEKKQGGDLLTSCQPCADASPTEDASSHSAKKDQKVDGSLTSTMHLDSPSAARFSRMQLSRISPPATLPTELAAVPELGLVATAFDSLGHLSDSRVSRLLSQLCASTARIQELEDALEAQETERAQLQQVRSDLSELSMQYQELVQEADAKDAAVTEMVKQLQTQLHESASDREQALEQQLAEERRSRERDRRDYEVRIQGLLNPNTDVLNPTHAGGDGLACENDAQLHAVIEQVKEHVRLTLEKDFDVRRVMEQRDLVAKVEQLQHELASVSTARTLTSSSEVQAELERQIDELTSHLDRRFEELQDLRSELDTIASQKQSAEERVARLEEELDTARCNLRDDSHITSSTSSASSSTKEQLAQQVDTLQTTLVEREAQLSRLQETLSLTKNRLVSVSAEHKTLVEQHALVVQTLAERDAHTTQLESHVLTLESQLRLGTEACEPTPALPAQAKDAETRAADQIVPLQRQLSSLRLQLIKMQKANAGLQEDNVNFSIALSAKQLELGMVKRNARFALKSAAKHVEAAGDSAGCARSKPLASQAEAPHEAYEPIVFPVAPTRALVRDTSEQIKENAVPLQVEANPARLAARHMLAQRRALSTTEQGQAQARHTRRRQLVAA